MEVEELHHFGIREQRRIRTRVFFFVFKENGGVSIQKQNKLFKI